MPNSLFLHYSISSWSIESDLFCVVVFDWYLAPELAGDKDYIDKCLRDSEQVQAEDIWLCERVQKGLESPVFTDGGRYAPELEGGEYMFHQRLHADYLAAVAKAGK